MSSPVSRRVQSQPPDLQSPAFAKLEAQLQSTISMLTPHFATVSQQLKLVTDMFREEAAQGGRVLQLSASPQWVREEAHASAMNSNGSTPSNSPFSMLQGQAQGHPADQPGSPLGGAVLSSHGSDSKVSAPESPGPSAFAHLTDEEELQLTDMIQESLKRHIAAIYLGEEIP